MHVTVITEYPETKYCYDLSKPDTTSKKSLYHNAYISMLNRESSLHINFQ